MRSLITPRPLAREGQRGGGPGWRSARIAKALFGVRILVAAGAFGLCGGVAPALTAPASKPEAAPLQTARLPARAGTGIGTLWQQDARFVDEHGRATTLQDLAGRDTVVAMEYSSCRFLCTMYWRRLLDIQTEADRLQRPLQFIVISLEPEKDTPAAWREYRKIRGLSRDNWHFLTSDRPSTDRIARWLGVRWWYYENNIMHDFRVMRFNPSGRLEQVMEQFDQSAADFLGPAPHTASR